MENSKKKNNLAHLTSALAILALLICMIILMCIKVVKDKKVENTLDETELAMEVENGDTESMLMHLEEVQAYLETLESAVEDSNLTLNTLANTKEDDEETKILKERFEEINNQMSLTKTDVSKLIEQINKNEEYDVSAMTENFLSVFSKVEELNKAIDSTMKDLENVQSINHTELVELAKKLDQAVSQAANQNKSEIDMLNKEINKQINTVNENFISKSDSLNQELNKQINIVNENFNSKSDKLNQDLGSRFDGIDAKLDQVFQYVADGKKSLASALATIGCNDGISSDTNQPVVLPFEVLESKIKTSQNIRDIVNPESGESIALLGAISDNLPTGVAAWVEGDYVVGNGADIDNAYKRGYDDGFNDGYNQGYEQGYDKGYADGLSEIKNAHIAFVYHEHTTSDGTVRPADYRSQVPDGCFTKDITRTESYTYTYVCGYKGSGKDSEYQYTCPSCGGGVFFDESYYGPGVAGVFCRGDKNGTRTGYRQVHDYYGLGCGCSDYATSGEQATVVSATIEFNH